MEERSTCCYRSAYDARVCVSQGYFPLKMKDTALQAAINYLRAKGCFPEDTGDSDDDDMVFGDDAFEEYGF